MTFIDLFAGCGGLSFGFEQAGFKPLFANEIVPVAAETYRATHDIAPENVVVDDIRNVLRNVDYLPKSLKDAAVLCGGPPCQGFSNANRQRVLDDPRNVLYKAFVQFAAFVRPKFIVLENVRGMAAKVDEIIADFKEALGDEYSFTWRLLQAADFGVPQNRVRFILVGDRIGVDPETVFANMEEISKASPRFVLRDALEGLPRLGHRGKSKRDEESEQAGFTKVQFEYPDSAFRRFINNGRDVAFLHNHKNRYNNERDIEIYSRLPQGGNSLHESIADIMPYKKRNGIFKDKYFKLVEGDVCKTITSHMRFDCNMYIHPWYARGLSAREAARIQTFPDDFVFKGAPNSWYFQVGNAVPVKLAEAIARSVSKCL